MPSLPVDVGLGAAASDKADTPSPSLPLPQVHTPPTTDEASHKDDDAASSSSLSDLGDDIDDEENRMRFEDAARAGAEAEQFSEVKPDRYENGVPIFTPVCNSPLPVRDISMHDPVVLRAPRSAAGYQPTDKYL